MTDKHDAPVQRIKRGLIQAAIWRNEGEKGPYHTVTLDRSYRDSDGNWQSTGTFGRDDLLVVRKVADLAYDAVCELQERTRSQSATREGGGKAAAGSEPEGAAAPAKATRIAAATNGAASRDSR